jgi:alpha-methylacyl-CoA racemase
MGPFNGIKVLDLSRLAPGPYATMLLADLGAEVVSVLGGRAGAPAQAVRRGKREIVLDLKSEPGQRVLTAMVKAVDVIVEGFRPGAARRVSASYEELSAINPRIVYCSVTGYGQDGPLAQSAGHDINYLAISGLLGGMETPRDWPRPPFNIVGDFAGGGLLAAFGIAAALVERDRSGQGQAIDVSMVDGVISLMAMINRDYGTAVLPVGEEGLTTGASPFYRCYQCGDGRYVAVGAAEDRFFANLWTGLGMELPVPIHLDPTAWTELSARIAARFLTRSRDEWARVFEGTDSCVTPVLNPHEAREHPHNIARGAFEADGASAPVPRFSRTPGVAGRDGGCDQTATVLREYGLDEALIAEVVHAGSGAAPDGLVKWPPY